MEQAKTTKDKTVHSKKDPLILRKFKADGDYHLPKEKSYFSMSHQQNLAVMYCGNQETDDCKKLFDKGKYNVIDQASLVDENPGYPTKDTHLNEMKQIID